MCTHCMLIYLAENGRSKLNYCSSDGDLTDLCRQRKLTHFHTMTPFDASGKQAF